MSRGKLNEGRVLNVLATAYVSFCDTGCIGKTATGIDVSKKIDFDGLRIIAVDPKVIKLHSIVKVETKNETFLAYAGDTGGDIIGHRIDILVAVRDTSKAFAFGKETVKLTVLREGKG
ncbi:3D domain-containing protein [Robertmurraya siralis]|uniref:3D domain-containing protein n=1 Tax=Robertmurraya siralis TaxID=77777 RepID=UPI001476CE9E|nr:3D domain-containing protein [Robertmurraya siralis]